MCGDTYEVAENLPPRSRVNDMILLSKTFSLHQGLLECSDCKSMTQLLPSDIFRMQHKNSSENGNLMDSHDFLRNCTTKIPCCASGNHRNSNCGYQAVIFESHSRKIIKYLIGKKILLIYALSIISLIVVV